MRNMQMDQQNKGLNFTFAFSPHLFFSLLVFSLLTLSAIIYDNNQFEHAKHHKTYTLSN